MQRQDANAEPRARFEPRLTPPPRLETPARWFVFRDGNVLIATAAGDLIPRGLRAEEIGAEIERSQYLGTLDGVHCFSAEMKEAATVPTGMELIGLRQLFGRVEDAVFWTAARAVQIVAWDRDHQFCGRCGRPTLPRPTERARECQPCGLLFFPRLPPAVIILIERGDEVLLQRSDRLPPGVYSVVAGFVEAGETLEEAAAREIEEEVGIRVKNLRYFGSQPWPFPNSLMLAFTAEYAGGELHIDDREIQDARWFRADAMPQIPGPISVSRELIDWFLAKHGR